MRTLTTILLGTGSLLLAACVSPAHLQPDFGYCYQAAFIAQADLDRPTATDLDYALSGVEALAIQEQAAEKTTDEATAVPMLIGVAPR